MPDTLNGNVASITFLAWDQTGATLGKQGTKVTTAVNGGSSPFSSAMNPATASINVADVNDAPTMGNQTILVPLSTPAGGAIGSLAATDVDLPQQTLTYAIVSGDTGAFGINSINTRTAQITVGGSGVPLAYSATPIGLGVVVTDNGNDPAPLSSAPSTITVETWQVASSATLIGADSSTTLTVNLQFPVPTQKFDLAINWGDGQTLNEMVTAGTMNITHFYAGNPDVNNPAASIPIGVILTDTQGHVSNASTSAPVPGTGVPGVAVVQQQTSTLIVASTPAPIVATPTTATVEAAVAQASEGGVAPNDVTQADDRRVSLRIVDAAGVEGVDIPMPDRLLGNLPDLFKRLPDGHYRVYMAEGGRSRLVIDVVVRGGRPIDPSEDAGGTGDRPPTSQIRARPGAGCRRSRPIDRQDGAKLNTGREGLRTEAGP